MTTVIFIDSRVRTSGTDSDFEVDLRESVHLSNARLRVDKLTFTDSFLTTDAGAHLYFSDGAGQMTSVQIPEGAYTGPTLAAAIQTATGRTTTYDIARNSITHTIGCGARVAERQATGGLLGWFSDGRERAGP